MTVSAPKPEPASRAAGPWTLKGVDPEARELAQDLARRSGVSLGEWLNQMIAGIDEEAATAPGASRLTPSSSTSVLDAESFRTRRREAGRGSAIAAAPRIASALAEFTRRLEAAEHRSSLMERDQTAFAVFFEGALDEVRDAHDRASQRLRSMEGGEGTRIEAMKALEEAIGRMAAQMREGEARAGDQASRAMEAALALSSRIEHIEAKPISDISPLDAALARLAERVDQIESARSPTFDTSALDTAFARLVYRVEDDRQRTSTSIEALESAIVGLDQRFAGVEIAPSPSEADTAFDAIPAHMIEDAIDAEVAKDVPAEALDAFFAEAADPYAWEDAAEAAVEGDEAEEAEVFADAGEGVAEPEAPIFEMHEVEAPAPETTAAQPADDEGGKLDRIEAAVRELAHQMAATERRSADAIDRMGGEVARIAQGLDGRVGEVERRSDERATHMGGEIARIADAMESRLSRADGAQAEALEKLGGEIASVAERLADRITASERRNAQDLTNRMDEVSGQLQRAADRMNTRYESAAVDLADHIRQSEERTARLIADVRTPLEAMRLDDTASEPFASAPFEDFAHTFEAAAEEPRFDTGLNDEADALTGETAVADHETSPFSADAPRRGSTRELIEHALAAARANTEAHRRASETGLATMIGETAMATPEPTVPAREAPAPRSAFSLLRLGRREKTSA